MGRGAEEQGWSRGGLSAKEGRAEEEEHSASTSTEPGCPMWQGDWDGDSEQEFMQGELEGDKSEGSRGHGDWDGESRAGSKGPGEGSL